MRFIAICLAWFLILAFISYYGLVEYVFSLGGLTWEQSKEVVWTVLLTIPFWKKALIIIGMGFITYFGAWWAFLPIMRKK